MVVVGRFNAWVRGDSAGVQANLRWLDEHPVRAALSMGLFWGLASGITFGAIHGTWWAVPIFVVVGVIAFGPIVVLRVRAREVKKRDRW